MGRAVVLKEPHRLGIEAYPGADVVSVFTLFHFFVCVFKLFVVGSTGCGRHMER